jgi:hypothetical protein
MLKRRFFALSFVAIIALLAVSCLKCEKKTYTWNFTGPNSGTLTVKYINITSEIDYEDEENSTDDQILTDYNDMITRFVDGTEAEQDFPDAEFIGKRLFEENGTLCGEAVYEFTDISQVKLYKHSKSAPIMYYTTDSVYYTNGVKGPSYMPVVFWEQAGKEIQVCNNMTTTEGESLLSLWKRETAKKKEKPLVH